MKKGFTLIELLAVILILGIIAVIAVPTVNKIIEESKKGVFKVSVDNIVATIKDNCELEGLEGSTVTETYTFTDGEVSPELNIKGKLPTSGTATVDNNCDVALNVTNGTFTAIKELISDDIDIILGAPTSYTEYVDGTAIYFNPVTGSTCTSGEAVSTTGTKTGCMKWYTFNDDENSSTINLILDHNTTALAPWNLTGSNLTGANEILSQLNSDTSNWVGVPTRTDDYILNNGTANYTINYSTYKARLITANEIAEISGHSTFDEVITTSDDGTWFYLDSNSQSQTATTPGSSNYAWLYDYTWSCTNNGCNVSDESNFGYWTATATSGNGSYAWMMTSGGALDFYFVDNETFRGVRPVITILKSNI